ncbi:MAG TPA: alpha/beta hydrolase-fold protein [Draconibacterium sp.]|nr:alpha/beta hydrolase-fold protein [Draconibacterium sp.]
MKTRFFFIFLLIPSFVFAQSGKVLSNLTLTSEILNVKKHYSIYLPPDYETSERSYPVLYLLHGGGEDHQGWVQFGEVKYIADKAINDGSAAAMIIVMPDAATPQRGYFNWIDGDWLYEDFFFEEFIPYIETTYRITREKRSRAISGLSMGGGGTFVYALHHPEMFSSACPLSASSRVLTVEAMKNRPGRFGSVENKPEEEIQAYIDRYCVHRMIENMPEEQKNEVRWFIDCGDDDGLSETNCMLHIAMAKNEIPHEYRVRDGAHSWAYWRDVLPTVLSYISVRFHFD